MADYESTAPSVDAVTLTEIKSHLNMDMADDDGVLSAYRDAAVELLEAQYNRCFVNRTRVLTMNGFTDSRYVHDRKIYPPRSPLYSVASITYVAAAGTTTTLPSSDYDVSTNDKPGHISEAYNATWPDTRVQDNSVTVTYTAGHGSSGSDVPNRTRIAVKQLVGHWYRQREAITEVAQREIPFGVTALMGQEGVEDYG